MIPEIVFGTALGAGAGGFETVVRLHPPRFLARLLSASEPFDPAADWSWIEDGSHRLVVVQWMEGRTADAPQLVDRVATLVRAARREDPPELSAKQVAKLAGVHQATLVKHAREGLVRSTRRSGRWLFSKEDAQAYVDQVDGLLRQPGPMVLDEAFAAGFMSYRQVCEIAGVSRPTLVKHVAAGLVRSQHERFAGRRIAVIERAEAERYARIAPGLVDARKQKNASRGPALSTADRVTMRDLSRMSRRRIEETRRMVRDLGIETVVEGSAVFVPIDAAQRFLRDHALDDAPEGLTSIPDAAKRSGLEPSHIHYAIRTGHVAAVPADGLATNRPGHRRGRPKTLVSLKDVTDFAAMTTKERVRQSHLRQARRLIDELQGDDDAQ